MSEYAPINFILCYSMNQMSNQSIFLSLGLDQPTLLAGREDDCAI